MAPSRSYGRVSITTLFETMRRPFCAELQVSINRVNCVPCQISYIRGGPGQWDHGTVGSRWRPSPVPALVHAGLTLLPDPGPVGKVPTDLEGRDDAADEAAVFAGVQGAGGCAPSGAWSDAGECCG